MKLAANIELGQLRGRGNIGLESDVGQIELGQTLFTFSNILSLTIGILTIVAFIWFIFKLIIGALGVMSAGGDKGKLTEARANITYALTGLIMVVAAIFIAGIVGIILGVDILEVSSTIANIGNAF